MTFRVMLVDDQELVLHGIASLIATNSTIDILGTFTSGQDCLDALSVGNYPDVILLDVNMPDLRGPEVFRRIQAICDKPVIFLTTFDDHTLLRQSYDLRAAGILSKNISKEKLIESIQRVARGEKLYNNKILNSSNLLTPRETEIARSLMRGLTTKEIAREQALSPGTVRNYLSNLFGKLEARNRSEALVKLNERGLL